MLILRIYWSLREIWGKLIGVYVVRLEFRRRGIRIRRM